MGWGVPLPSRLWSLWRPENEFWCIFSLKEHTSDSDKFEIFDIFAADNQFVTFKFTITKHRFHVYAVFHKKHPVRFFCYISAKCCSMIVKIGTNIYLLNYFKPCDYYPWTYYIFFVNNDIIIISVFLT